DTLENAPSEKRTQDVLAQATIDPERDALTTPMAALMTKALEARDVADFTTARSILTGVRAVQGDLPDPFVIQQLAVATYKSKDLDSRQRLVDARAILAPLGPEASSDPETLGIWGAIHKRLADLDVLPD